MAIYCEKTNGDIILVKSKLISNGRGKAYLPAITSCLENLFDGTETVVNKDKIYFPSGGISFNGEAYLSILYNYHSSGGWVEFTGNAGSNLGANIAYIASGGILFSGESMASLESYLFFPGEGSITFGGEAGLSTLLNFDTSGGIIFSGNTLYSTDNGECNLASVNDNREPYDIHVPTANEEGYTEWLFLTVSPNTVNEGDTGNITITLTGNTPWRTTYTVDGQSIDVNGPSITVPMDSSYSKSYETSNPTGIADTTDGNYVYWADVVKVIPATPKYTTIPSGCIYPCQIEYLGKWRLPADDSPTTGRGYDYGGLGLAYNPDGDGGNGSLYVISHIQESECGEMTIPTPSMSSTLSALPQATNLQDITDVTHGWLDQVQADYNTSVMTLSGLLVYENRLLWNMYAYYDVGPTDYPFTGTNNLDISVNDTEGPWLIGNLPSQTAGGYMYHVPAAWQSAFGVPILSGSTGTSIRSQTGEGPIAIGWDPYADGPAPPFETVLDATTFMRYTSPHSNRLHYVWDGYIQDWKGDQLVRGGAFPVSNVNGRSALIYSGTLGRWPGEWYSTASAFPYNRPDSPGCNTSAKGFQNAPRESVLFFYDPNELLKVKNGTIAAHEVEPYFILSISEYLTPGYCGSISGMCLDTDRNRLYIIEPGTDTYTKGTFGGMPLMHVFQIN